MNSTWVRYLLAAYITITIAVSGWIVADRATLGQRVEHLSAMALEYRLVSERSIAEVRLTSAQAVADVRLTSQTTNAQMTELLRRLDRMESKLDALQR